MDKRKLDSGRDPGYIAGYILVFIGAILMIGSVVMAVARTYMRLKLPFILFASGAAVFTAGAIALRHNSRKDND